MKIIDENLPLFKELVDNDLYSPASLAMRSDLSRLDRQRLRIAMNRVMTQEAFPDNGDGRILYSGKVPIPGWFGWRWKRACLKGDDHA